jgi:hypothetical protein
METMVKTNIEKMKNDIKESAEKQKFYRNQKKTVHIIGERKMLANEATYEHQKNGHKLRIMYAAYGLARGKSFSQIEKRYDLHNEHPLIKYQYDIDKLLKQYEI